MVKKTKKSPLAGIPAWALSLMAFFISWIFLILLVDETGSKDDSFLFVVSLLLIIFLAIACFMITRVHPGSVWYTPLICNVHIISSIVSEYPFWTRSLMVWVMLGIGIALSVVGAMVGARIGRQRIKQAK